MKKIVITTFMIAAFVFGGQRTFLAASSQSVSVPDVTTLPLAARTQPLIIDHTTADINAIPQKWIEAAKQNLHIGYGHTSHGSQISSGMYGLVSFANNGGLGLNLPTNIFQPDPNSNEGGSELHFFEGSGYDTSGDLALDAGYDGWDDRTRNYLGTPDPATGRGTAHPEINVIMWSWCGQVSGKTGQSMLDDYLFPMTQLETEYPGIIFVYMTGHADGSGEEGNLHIRNQQIRQYAVDNNKVLFDFYDFDIHDPDGTYYGNKAVTDELWYDSDENGSRDKNWGTDWQNTHPQNDDWYSVSCAHSQAINCNQKAYGIWWLWANLAGWNAAAPEFDLSSSSKAASQGAAQTGDTVTYTIQVINDTGALTNTVHLTDTVPAGLAYIPGSLSASSGSVDESNAPILTWTGVLTPTPEITVTYAVTVTAVGPQAITNTAVMGSPGYGSIERSATLIANGYQVYLPLIFR
jgi:uncharacterized repeat protein (TIGR01451 family)